MSLSVSIKIFIVEGRIWGAGVKGGGPPKWTAWAEVYRTGYVLNALYSGLSIGAAGTMGHGGGTCPLLLRMAGHGGHREQMNGKIEIAKYFLSSWVKRKTLISVKAYSFLYKLRSFESLLHFIMKCYQSLNSLPLCFSASRWRCLASEKAFLVLLLLWRPWGVKHSSPLFGMM